MQPGTTLGRYQILEPLGSGGMATVYKAYEPSLDRVVALKVIRPGLAGEADFVARFRREAQAVARLAHPNIVQVFGFDEIDGLLFLAMQYLEGGTLKDRLTTLAPGERLERTEVTSIVSQVADALAYAHELGVVHRDMKPSNVMLTRNRAVVTDFGIARIVAGEQLTQTGVGIGTPEYMAPEQGAGARVDARADIYSLGVVVYELLCGRVPFVADTPFAVVAAHMRDPLPLPHTLAPDLPEAAERVLLKALAKDPSQRFSTAPELASALGDAFAGHASVAPAAVRPRARAIASRRAALIGASVALVALVGGGAVLGGAFGERSPAGTPAPASSPIVGAAGGTQTPSARGSPSASSPHAIPPKGALFFQAKLDGTDSDVRAWNVDLGGAANTTIRYAPGAIDLAVTAGASSGFAEVNMPARSAFVGELDIAATTSARQGTFFIWVLRTCGAGELQLVIHLGEEKMELVDALGPGRGRDLLSTLIAVPSLKNGTPHTIAVAASSTNVSVYLDEKSVADVPYSRCNDSTRALLRIGTDVGPTGTESAGIVRVTGLRYYALPG